MPHKLSICAVRHCSVEQIATLRVSRLHPNKNRHVKRSNSPYINCTGCKLSRWEKFSLVFVLSLLIGWLVACSSQTSQELEIRIGLNVDVNSLTGQSAIEAAQLAAQEVNDAGGLDVGGHKRKITLVIEDNKKNPEGAVNAAAKLINQENVVAIVGPNQSQRAIPVARVAEEARIPMISPLSTNPETTAGKQYAFRVAFIDPFQGQVMARFASEEFNAQKAAVLYDVSNVYSKKLAEIFKGVFEEAGGQIVAFETFTSDEQDFREYLTHIQESEPEVLFLPNFAVGVITQTLQARQMGLQIPIIGSDSWDKRLLVSYPEFEGAFFSHHWSLESANQQSQAFIEAYRLAFSKEPVSTAALTYDAFGLLFQAIQSQGQADPEAIRQGLANTRDYNGVTGIITYQGSGDPTKSAVIYKITGGEAVFYKQVDPSEFP